MSVDDRYLISLILEWKLSRPCDVKPKGVVMVVVVQQTEVTMAVCI